MAGLLSLFALTWTADPAAAHTNVSGSTPANGATVKSLDSVSIQFVGPVMEGFADVALTTEDDQPVQLSEPVVESKTVTATIDGPQPEPGLYTLSYRAVSVDGHSITGSLAFTLDPSTTASNDQDTLTPSAPAPNPRPEGPLTVPSAESSSASGAGPLAIGGGLGVALLVVALWAFRRRAER